VIDMQRAQREAQLGGEIHERGQEHSRIHAAREAENQVRAGRDRRRERRRYPRG
jgi:hypothetical protein